ncbi:YSIRK-type signal peptide-containing protein, partial [Staphylococcus haemolyticus]|uniref:YSIRK-type signal peptide-containing protein n=1 Tax=Staphylococcus haemolyticus TaxID=1283 RepID=UPI002884498B
MKKKSNKRLDFLPNRLNKYSIRKFTVGTASILVGATLIFGAGHDVAKAAEDTKTEEGVTSNSDESAQSSSETANTGVETTEQATAEQPTTEEKATEESTTEQPSTEEKATEESTTEQPSTEEKASKESTTEQPSTEEKTSKESTTEQPSTEEKTSKESTTEQSSTEEKVTEESTTEQSSTEEKASKESTTEQASTEEKATSEGTTTEQPSAEEKASKESTTEQASTEEKATSEGTTEQPSREEATKETTTNQPISEKETVNEVKNVANETGVSEDEILSVLNKQGVNKADENEILAALIKEKSATNDQYSTPVVANTTNTSSKTKTTSNTPVRNLLRNRAMVMDRANTSDLQESAENSAIYSPGDATKKQTYSGKAWVYRNGNHSNYSQKDALPLSGVNVYLQWVNGKGVVSPVYYTTTNPDGSFAFDLSKPVTDENGNSYEFKLAGDSKFAIRTWVKNPDPSKYDVVKHGDQMYGYHDRLTRKNESWDFTAGINRIVNSHVVLQEKHNNVDWLLKPENERTTSGTSNGQFENTGAYGTIRGNVWYENGDPNGSDARRWGKDSWDVNATNTKVAASYVNDEVTRLFDTWKNEHSGYTLDDFKAAQAQIIADYEAKNGVGSHIAETVVANVDSKGDYYIPFKGIYGISAYKQNSGASISKTISDEEYGKVVADKDVSHNNLMAWNGTIGQKHRHINSDYVYVTPLVDDYAIWSNNFQTNMFEGLSDDLLPIGPNAQSSYNTSGVDFALLAPQPMHDITNYNSTDELARPGDTAESRTGGLLPNREYQVQWFKNGEKFGDPVTVTSAEDGTVGSVPLTVPEDAKVSDVFSSAVFKQGVSTESLTTALAIDSFSITDQQPDNEVYEPTTDEVTKDHGTPTTEDDVTGAVT